MSSRDGLDHSRRRGGGTPAGAGDDGPRRRAVPVSERNQHPASCYLCCAHRKDVSARHVRTPCMCRRVRSSCSYLLALARSLRQKQQPLTSTTLNIWRLLGGYPKNSDESPNTRERVLGTFKHKVRVQRDCNSLCRMHKFQKSESVYTCPHAPFYREMKGLLHTDNTLRLREYS
jgi:hypothetical protein